MLGGTVAFSLAPCIEAKGRVFSDGTVLYSIWNPTWTMQKSFAWKSSDSGSLHQSFHVPPGAYTYEVYATAGTDPNAIACSAHYFVAVLPNTERRVVSSMSSGVSDPIPLTYVYGTLPKGAHVDVVEFNGFPKCGGGRTSMPSRQIEVERDDVGYYASVEYPYTVQSPPAEAALGIIIRLPGDLDGREILATARLPENIVALTPNAIRLDVTPETLVRIVKASPSTLICLP
jgi:hypothetical protein